jgi:hypothetical protein
VTSLAQRTILVAASLLALGWCQAAAADGLREQETLAAKYAPVIRLVTQSEDCGHGEPYRPLDVNALFGADTVALRGPWNRTDLVKIAPTAADLGQGLYEYHLDFPGNPLDPGCGYEQWARTISAGTKPTVYAHVTTDPGYPGKLALQYWIFYVFNDWNNLHEGDWEMIQLDFDASTPQEALGRSPVEVGYSQHEGAERAEWGSPKLELVDGTHPVVHVAAGSHANFYDEALYLGSSASQGVGCDDTRGPTFVADTVVRTIPTDPAQAREHFPWIGFQGRWGELQPAFYNGPTGPNLKLQWTEPIRWSQDWRSRSYAVPAGGVLGTGASDFFCAAVEHGSGVLRRLIDNPGPALLALIVLIGLAAFGLSRATWRPSAPLRLGHRRSWGQIVTAAARMYWARPLLFVGLGLILIPVSVFLALLQTALASASSIFGIQNGGQGGGALVLLAVAFGAVVTLLGLALVQAATVRALLDIEAGRPAGALQAYRIAFGRLWPVVGAVAVAVVAVLLLTSVVVLIPLAVWLAVRLALVVPVIELDGVSAVEGLRRSSRLVRHGWLKVASLTLFGLALALVAGPLVGALLILLTNMPIELLNVIAGIVYAVTVPFFTLTTAYVYFDARVREELADDGEPDALPAEIELA